MFHGHHEPANAVDQHALCPRRVHCFELRPGWPKTNGRYSAARNRPLLKRIRKLLEIIATAVADRDTIDELLQGIDDQRRWKDAHALFSRIRQKTLRAHAANDGRLIAQYVFEEYCAKAIYNESGERAPFDSGCAFWVIPFAFAAARELGVDQSRVLAVVSA